MKRLDARVRRACFGVLLTAITRIAHAQSYYLPITISTKLVAMIYNSSTGAEDAPFNLNCTFTNAYLTIDGYQWRGYGLTFDTPTTKTTVAQTSGPGQCSAKVDVYAHASGQLPYSLHLNGWNTEYCAAFGGPITFSAISGSVPTYLNDGGNGLLYPWYVQYFRPLTQAPVAGDQTPQGMKASLIASQPGTTTVTWTIGSLDAGGANLTNVGPGSLNLQATAAGTNTISVSYHCAWTDQSDRSGGPLNAALNNTGPDDTSGSRSNQIHAHKPTTTTWSQIASKVFQNPLPTGTTGWERDYALTLKDQDGTAMPDVWFNEQWTTAPPGDITVNTTANPWISGASNPVDYLAKNWPAPSSGWVNYDPVHHYMAATNSVTGGGIDTATANVTMHYGSPNNSPNPADVHQ